MDKNRACQEIEDRFRKLVSKDRDIHVAHLLVHSGSKDIHLKVADGDEGVYAHPDQPQFTASVGKMFASTIIAMLEEKGELSYDDPVTDHLDDEIAESLHVMDGVDHTKDIRLKHLLNHTSGLNDYFDEGTSIKDMDVSIITDDPDRFWTPQDLIRLTKDTTKPKFAPGKGFSYSSTGYQILGLVIENLTSMPYHDALSRFFFRPLGMQSSYLIQRSEPIVKSEHPVAGVYLGDQNLIDHRTLSEEYAAGGIVSSAEDMLKFIRAFAGMELINADSYAKMQDWAKFGLGLDYGYGLMRFKKTPLIMPFEFIGHAGSTGTFMIHNFETDTSLVGGLHQHCKHGKALRMAFMSQMIVNKIR